MLTKLINPLACVFISLISSAAFSQSNFQVLVNGNGLTWSADTVGYIQVQEAHTWITLCEFDVKRLRSLPSQNRNDTTCNVPSGKYDVLNHYTRQRINGITVGNQDGSYTAPALEFDANNQIVKYEPYLALSAENIFHAFEGVERPEALSAKVYSPTAAELFWNRAAAPGLTYDILIDDVVLSSTDGTSYFLTNLQSDSSYNFIVRARNSQGEISPISSVSVQTPTDKLFPEKPEPLPKPTGVKAEVYSETALELFWDRKTAGQLFQVLNENGDTLIQTEGTSYFLSGLRPENSYQFSVVSVDTVGNTSEPVQITVDTRRHVSKPSITISNANSVLKFMVAFTNGKPFRNIEQLMAPGVSAVLDASINYIQNGSTSTGLLTLVEGTGGGPDTINFSGLNGGQYTCVAGGSAEGLSIFGGETGQSYVVSLNECLLPQGRFTGRVQSLSGGRSGYSGSSYSNVEFIQSENSTEFQYDASSRVEIPFRNNGQIDSTSTVNLYTIKASGGESEVRLFDFQSFVSSRVGLAFADDPNIIGPVLSRNAFAQVTFSVELSGETSNALPPGQYYVSVDLEYYGDVEATNPVDLWNSGSIIVTAADGSRLVATPADTDSDMIFESISISVGNQSNNYHVNDGYLVSCQRAELEACNLRTAEE